MLVEDHNCDVTLCVYDSSCNKGHVTDDREVMLYTVSRLMKMCDLD